MQQVTLSGGDKIQVHPIDWRSWRTLREAFANALKSEHLAELINAGVGIVAGQDEDEISDTGEVESVSLLVDGADDETPIAPQKTSQPKWLSALPKLLDGLAAGAGLVTVLLGDLTEQLVRGCTSLDDDQINAYRAADILKLRAAAVAESDVKALLAAEGNLFAGLLELAGDQAREAKSK